MAWERGYLRGLPVGGQWGFFQTMDILIQELAGLAVWLVANGVYLDLRRKGEKGFARLVSFWLGMPVTLFSLMLVPEGSQPRIRPPPDDDSGLLEEVRRDRALRAGPATEDDPGELSEEED
jgi:hypothetical protein